MSSCNENPDYVGIALAILSALVIAAWLTLPSCEAEQVAANLRMC